MGHYIEDIVIRNLSISISLIKDKKFLFTVLYPLIEYPKGTTFKTYPIATFEVRYVNGRLKRCSDVKFLPEDYRADTDSILKEGALIEKIRNFLDNPHQ
jgi:hypothetical protein